MISAGVPSCFSLGWQDGHVPTDLASTVENLPESSSSGYEGFGLLSFWSVCFWAVGLLAPGLSGFGFRP